MVEEAIGRKAVEVKAPAERPAEYFGKYVFDRDKMRKYLPKACFETLMNTMKNGSPLDRETADCVAAGMKQWAQDMGATHYTHWFQPLTGGTAETEDFFYLEHFAVQPSLRGQGTGSRILRELLQGEKPFILEIEPPEDALTCRRKAFYERNGLQAQPYDHVQLPFQGGGPIVPLVIMADRAISPAQCRTFQRYLLDRVVKYTQYGK